MNDPPIQRCQVIVGVPRRRQSAGHAGFVDEIGELDQALEYLPVVRLVEVQLDGALVRVVRAELPTAQVVRRSSLGAQRQRRPGRGAAGRLDLDHIGTELAQQPGAELAAVIGQVEHRHAGERCRRGVL